MKWLRPDISHLIDVVRHMENLGEAMKWMLQCFRHTSVTYNDFSSLVCGNYNIDFAGFWIKGDLPHDMSQSIILEDKLEVE